MEREISLREVIEIVIRGKWIVLSVTLVAIVFSGIISFFVISPTYETNSIVSVMQNSTDDKKPKQDLNAFAESLNSDASISLLIDKLKLEPSKYSINSIRRLIQLEVVNDANLMKIKVKGKEPLLITNISNLLAYELGSRIEIAEQSQMIVESQRNLKDVSGKIQISKSELVAAQNQLKNISEKQVTKQTITRDVLLHLLLKESTGAKSSDIAGLQMESETLNPAFTDLQTKIAEIMINLTSSQTEAQNLKSTIHDSTVKINQLEQLLLQDKLNAKVFDKLLDGYQAVFISPAYQPTVPVSPNKLMNIIVAAVLAIIIGVMIIIFRNYMQVSSTPLNAHR